MSTSLDRSSPADIKVTQMIPGSHNATIEWSFPEDATVALAQFQIIIKKEEDGTIGCQPTVAPLERQVTINSLQPSTKYTVTVRADYQDGIPMEGNMEHTNCELHAFAIMECAYIHTKLQSWTLQKLSLKS